MKALSPICRAGFVLLALTVAAAAWAADGPPSTRPTTRPTSQPTTTAASQPTTLTVTTNGIGVTLDLATLPRKPGWTVVRADGTADGKPMPMLFGLWLPKGYAAGGPPLPVIVHLHNRFAIGRWGEEHLSDEGLPAVLCRGQLMDNRSTGQAAVVKINPNADVAIIGVVPHCPDGEAFEAGVMPRVVDAMVSAVVQAYAADADRVYLTGFSYGGSSTWQVAEQTPMRWAAIAPMDGRRTENPTLTAARLKHVGVWVTEGDVDGDFTNDGRLMRDTLAAAGHQNFTYREVAGGNHFTYNRIYVDPAFWGWLLGQRRHKLTAGEVAEVAAAVKATANQVATAVRPVDVALRPADLPHAAGFHLVTADLRLDGKPQQLQVGLFLPADYGASATATYPLVLALHNKATIEDNGRGDLARDGLAMFLANKTTRDPRQTGQAPAAPIDPRVDVQAIIVAPQCPANHTWDDPAMLGVLDQLIVRVTDAYKADADRVYLTGWSYGGSMAWPVGAALADRLAAVASLDGRTPKDPTATVAKLRRVGIYQAVGSVDREFIPEAQRMVVALAAAQHPNFTFRSVPDGNHFCYGLVYTDPTFWSWLLAQRRDPAAAARMVVVDKANADRAAVEKAAADKLAAAAKLAAEAKAAAEKAAAEKKAAADKAAADKAAQAKRPTTKPAAKVTTAPASR